LITEHHPKNDASVFTSNISQYLFSFGIFLQQPKNTL
jgi:hypothetical protein